MLMHSCLFSPEVLFAFSGLALGLGIGALAEVAKKSIRHNNGGGKWSKDFILYCSCAFFLFSSSIRSGFSCVLLHAVIL